MTPSAHRIARMWALPLLLALCLVLAGCSCQSASVASGSSAASSSSDTSSASESMQDSSSSDTAQASGTSEETTMPNVTGLSRTDATQTLEDLGLNVEVAKRTVGNLNRVGVVLDQSPAQGATVQSGDTVTLTVGKKASSHSSSTTGATSGNATHMDDATSTYDVSTLPASARKTYRAASKALSNDDYKAMAESIAALYEDYPNAAQSLINTAKTRSWFPKFKKELLQIDAGANDILDLDA